LVNVEATARIAQLCPLSFVRFADITGQRMTTGEVASVTDRRQLDADSIFC
jgi:hypothetical protein